MSRPPLEVADIIRAAGEAFIERNRHWLRWKRVKVCGPSSGVVLPHSVAISTSAPAADIVPPSRITAAAIATARSVRSLHGNARSLRVGENSTDALRPCGLHLAQPLGATGSAEQEDPLRSPVPYQCRNPSRSGSQSETPRCGNWLLQRVAYLEPETKIHPHVHCVVPAGGLSPDHARWVRSEKITFFRKRCCGKSFVASLSTRSSKPSRTASCASRKT